MKLVLILALCIGGYFAWKHYSHTEDVAAPIPVASPTPTPNPQPTPEPTPLGRLAPPGELYVLETFSVEHDAGVHGFPCGKRVTLVAEQGDELVVTDGQMQATKARRFFTRDLDVVDKILSAEAKRNREVEERRQSLLSKQREEEEGSGTVRDASEFEKKSKHLEDLIARGKLNLETLRSRIGLARNERWGKGYPMDGGPRISRDGVSRSLSPDAANIRELLQNEIKLERRIGELELALQKHLRDSPGN